MLQQTLAKSRMLLPCHGLQVIYHEEENNREFFVEASLSYFIAGVISLPEGRRYKGALMCFIS